MLTNPFNQFNLWRDESIKHGEDVTLSALATCDKNTCFPSVRIILVKKFDENGFCFFTNLESRKSQELKGNPHAALCFHWRQTHYQVRIEGVASQTSDKEADDYFNSRPFESRLGAIASKQSKIMKNPDDLEKKILELKKTITEKTITRPKFWSGFRLIPNHFEFWHEGDFRLHTRYSYQKSGDDWLINQLYP